MAPGPEIPLHETGDPDESTRLYFQMVHLYGNCEDSKAAVVRALRDLNARKEDD